MPARDSEGPSPPPRARASLALPAAIAFGALVIAAALYAGLSETRRARHGALADDDARAAPHSEQELDGARKRATDEARVALEAQRGKLVSACWAKAAAEKPLPATATFIYAIALGSDGRELGRAVNEAKIGERPEVAACLRMAVTPIAITPPGQALTAKVPLTLP